MGIADGIERFYDRPRCCDGCGLEGELVPYRGKRYCQLCCEDRATTERMEGFATLVDQMEQGVLPERFRNEIRDLLWRAAAAESEASRLT